MAKKGKINVVKKSSNSGKTRSNNKKEKRAQTRLAVVERTKKPTRQMARTVYKELFSKRAGRRIELVRTTRQRKRVQSLKTPEKRQIAAKQIVKELKTWRDRSRNFKKKRARANIELRLKDATGRIKSKWISFKRRELSQADEDYLPGYIEKIISGYTIEGTEILGFRDIEFEAVKRPNKKKKNAKSKTVRKKQKRSRPKRR